MALVNRLVVGAAAAAALSGVAAAVAAGVNWKHAPLVAVASAVLIALSAIFAFYLADTQTNMAASPTRAEKGASDGRKGWKTTHGAGAPRPWHGDGLTSARLNS